MHPQDLHSRISFASSLLPFCFASPAVAVVHFHSVIFPSPSPLNMFKSVVFLIPCIIVALSAPLPDAGSAYTGTGGQASGGNVFKSPRCVSLITVPKPKARTDIHDSQ